MGHRAKDAISEIEFLRSLQETPERILEALGYAGKRESLRRALNRHERPDLVAFLFPVEKPEPVTYEHGTKLRYDTGCRCNLCGEAHTDYCRTQRHRRYSEPKDPNDPRHGKASFYRNHGCRCKKCSAAHKAQCSDLYKRRAERKKSQGEK